MFEYFKTADYQKSKVHKELTDYFEEIDQESALDLFWESTREIFGINKYGQETLLDVDNYTEPFVTYATLKKGI